MMLTDGLFSLEDSSSATFLLLLMDFFKLTSSGLKYQLHFIADEFFYQNNLVFAA